MVGWAFHVVMKLREKEEPDGAAQITTPFSATRIFGGRWVMVSVLIIAVLGLFALLSTLDYSARPAVQPGMVSIALVGRSTNELGQRSVAYRVQNSSVRNLLGIAEFTNATPNSGLFVKLPSQQPQTVTLAAPPAGSPCGMQLTCFVEDNGLLTRIYGAVQRFRGKQPHEITKLLFTIPGPPVEP